MTTNLSRHRFAAAAYTAFSAATVALLSAATPSIAEPVYNPVPTQKVTYADLDISKPAGAKILYHRIQEAADSVCEPRYQSARRLRDVTADCVKRAVERAVRSVDSPALADLHATKTLRVATRQPLTANR